MDYPTKELLKFILDSIAQIRFTFSQVEEVDDLLEGPEAIMRLDAISMRLQAIGETIKNIAGAFQYLQQLIGRKVDLIYPHKGANRAIIEAIRKEVLWIIPPKSY